MASSRPLTRQVLATMTTQLALRPRQRTISWRDGLFRCAGNDGERRRYRELSERCRNEVEGVLSARDLTFDRSGFDHDLPDMGVVGHAAEGFRACEKRKRWEITGSTPLAAMARNWKFSRCPHVTPCWRTWRMTASGRLIAATGRRSTRSFRRAGSGAARHPAFPPRRPRRSDRRRRRIPGAPRQSGSSR